MFEVNLLTPGMNPLPPFVVLRIVADQMGLRASRGIRRVRSLARHPPWAALGADPSEYRGCGARSFAAGDVDGGAAAGESRDVEAHVCEEGWGGREEGWGREG